MKKARIAASLCHIGAPEEMNLGTGLRQFQSREMMLLTPCYQLPRSVVERSNRTKDESTMHLSSTELPTCPYWNHSSTTQPAYLWVCKQSRNFSANHNGWAPLFQWHSVRLCRENELCGGRFHFGPLRVPSKASDEGLDLCCDAMVTRAQYGSIGAK